MKTSIADFLRHVAVKKGDVRNIVLRQVKVLRNTADLLNQGRDIKKREIPEHKSDKVRKLKNQISIITRGLGHIRQAIKELQEYKETSVHC